jgi:hypothetical protein
VELAERPLNADRFSLPRLEMSTFSPWQAPGSPRPSPSHSPPPRLEAVGGGRDQGIADEGRCGIGGDDRRQERDAGNGPREAAQVFVAERGGVVHAGVPVRTHLLWRHAGGTTTRARRLRRRPGARARCRRPSCRPPLGGGGRPRAKEAAVRAPAACSAASR